MIKDPEAKKPFSALLVQKQTLLHAMLNACKITSYRRSAFLAFPFGVFFRPLFVLAIRNAIHFLLILLNLFLLGVMILDVFLILPLP